MIISYYYHNLKLCKIGDLPSAKKKKNETENHKTLSEETRCPSLLPRECLKLDLRLKSSVYKVSKLKNSFYKYIFVIKIA